MQLVAPAGSYSALRAAVNNGADAVYLGMPLFGARAKADNFDLAGLKNAVEYAHLFGVKVFVTLNTLIKDREIAKALEFAEYAYDIGVDSAIVQDVRFIKELKHKLPKMPLHASTQMGVHNAEGAKALLDMGLKRVVLARETLPKDISAICKTGIETEYFVQGALCICFSGNCYFSSLASSYSGNRGKCMQLCRKRYKSDGWGDGYLLSAKDLCLYKDLGRLQDLGVDAIKIEGRMRSDEYVAQAVKVYKSNMPSEVAVNALKSVFNRGDYCSAYIEPNAAFNVVYSKSQSNIGISCGNIERVKGKKLITSVKAHPNDGFKVMRKGREICGASVCGGEIIADGNGCAAGDELRKTFDGALSEELSKTERRIPIDVDVILKAGEYPRVVVRAYDSRTETVGTFVPQPAISRSISLDDISRVFGKVSDDPFLPNIRADIDGELFMPISEINKLRRNTYAALRKDIISRNAPKRTQTLPFEIEYNQFNGSGIMIAVESFENLDPNIVDRVDHIALVPRDYANIPNKPSFINKPILLALPVTMRGTDRNVLKEAIDLPMFDGVISNNLYGLKLTDKPILLGVGHNIIGKFDRPHICSFEADELDDDAWIYAFGYAPLMTLCHCPHQKCLNCSGNYMLTDESDRKFALKRYKVSHCYWKLLNCVPHYLDTAKIGRNKNIYYDFTASSSKEIKSVLDGKYNGAYTRGNLNKGLK